MLEYKILMSCVSDTETDPMQSHWTNVLNALEEFFIQNWPDMVRPRRMSR